MKVLRKLISHLFEKPPVPAGMDAYCDAAISKINQNRFNYLCQFFIAAISIILLFYGFFVGRHGIQSMPLAYIIADALALFFLVVCYLLWRKFPFFREKGFLPLLYTICCTIYAWTIVLSVQDNSVTCLIIALLLFPIGFIIKPRDFLVMQALMLLPMMLAVSLLRMDELSMLTSAINTLLCALVSLYICRATYNLILQNVANMHALELKKEELDKLAAQLKNLSETDVLTGLLNRRKFNEVIGREWNRAIRSAQSLVVIILDVDYFKDYNDHYGHLTGDECLAKVGAAMREKFKRANEYTARYGGEEFVVVLAASTKDDGIAACERLLAAIAALQMPHAFSKAESFVTVSAGMAVATPKELDSLQGFIKKADLALYEAKEAGRNRYVVADEDMSAQ